MSHNITTFKLEFSHDFEPTTRVPFGTLLALLSRTTHLHTLHLTHAFHVVYNPAEDPPNQPVPLTSLTDLHLHASPAETRALLSNLAVPSCDDVQFHIRVRVSDEAEDPQSLLNFIGNHLQQPLGGWETAAVFATLRSPSVRFILQCGTQPEWDKDPQDISAIDELERMDHLSQWKPWAGPGTTTVLFDLPDEESIRTWLSVMPQTFQTLSVCRLRLRFVGRSKEDMGEGHDFPTTLFTSFPNITFLSLDKVPFIEAFANFARASGSTGSEVFPSLETVYVHLPRRYENSKELFRGLGDVFRIRHERGHLALRKLMLLGPSSQKQFLSECSLEIGGVQVVKNLVVKWGQ